MPYSPGIHLSRNFCNIYSLSDNVPCLACPGDHLDSRFTVGTHKLIRSNTLSEELTLFERPWTVVDADTINMRYVLSK